MIGRYAAKILRKRVQRRGARDAQIQARQTQDQPWSKSDKPQTGGRYRSVRGSAKGQEGPEEKRYIAPPSLLVHRSCSYMTAVDTMALIRSRLPPMSAKKVIGTAAVAFLLLAGPAAAQTTTGTTSTSTPGTPNTGAGGSAAANLIILGSTAAIALAGLTYLSRRNLPE